MNLLKQFEKSEAIVAPYHPLIRGNTHARLYGSSHGLLRIKGPAVGALKECTCYQINLLEEDGNKKLLIKFTPEEEILAASGRRHKARSKTTIGLGIAQFLNRAKIQPPARGMVFSFEEGNGLAFDNENKILLLDFSRCVTEKADWRKPTDNK